MKKLYIVKREVWADNIASAAYAKGIIYGIEEADEKFQPEEYIRKRLGFRKKKK